MNIADITTMRLANQQLVKTRYKTPREIVSWMGAMQAQDFNMAKWGIGVRLPGITDKQVEKAIDGGELIRTHILRPTWHFVSRDDIHWMLQLSSPRVKLAVRSSDRELELSDDLLKKTSAIIRKALEKESNQTRQELGAILKKADIECDSRRLSHIMFHAELDGLVCNGTVKDKKQTYALLEQRVPKTSNYNMDETLYRLAYKYFQSHGPATIQDFIWWSGLTATEARSAAALIKPDFIFETAGEQTYIYHQSSSGYKQRDDIVHFLPAFDELLVSYKDRKEILSLVHHKKVITSNGIFKPAISYNGEIIGLWKKILDKQNISSESEFFSQPDKALERLIKKASGDFDAYLTGS
ncbi:winged helix DNA-binding domain-containing protein [Dysgonomonas gadei]|uniref:winged helix DNA-binding domain-containing protein n=1 Tax=Dysgonomonas gadei TaxID=156974 RepID=UPI003AF1E1C7